MYKKHSIAKRHDYLLSQSKLAKTDLNISRYYDVDLSDGFSGT